MSLLDRLVRAGYRVAYRLLCVYWFAARPRHVGAVVAVWHGGRVLAIRTSYRAGWSLPGGGVARGEAPDAAARRELREELGLDIPALRAAGTVEDRYEYRRETIHLFEIELARPPLPRPDHREVVAAELIAPGDLLNRKLPPHVRAYLTQRARS